MISAINIGIGTLVKHQVLGQVWAIMAKDDDGTLHLERNGVSATASIWDVEVLTVEARSISQEHM